jgi:hypothetical protein
MTIREELKWLLTDRTAVRWWFNRLIVQRLNGERKAARKYGKRMQFARGGVVRSDWTPTRDCHVFRLSDGKLITDPDEAEALGLTADARRMRKSPPTPYTEQETTK